MFYISNFVVSITIFRFRKIMFRVAFLCVYLMHVHGLFVYIWGLDRGTTINNDNAYIKDRCGLDTVDGVQYFYVGGNGYVYRDTNTIPYSEIIFTYRGYGYDDVWSGGLSPSESCILEYSIDNGDNWINVWTKYNADLLDPSFYHVQQNMSISNGHGRNNLRIRIKNTGNSRYTDKCWFDYVGLIGVPTESPTESPTKLPTTLPTLTPTLSPTISPVLQPTNSPIIAQTSIPTKNPTINPTTYPSVTPTLSPTMSPVQLPTISPILQPTTSTDISSTSVPTTGSNSTISPSVTSTINPSTAPTTYPTITNYTYPPTNAKEDEIIIAPNSGKTVKNTKKSTLLSVILVSALLVLILLLLIFIYLFIKKKIQTRELQSGIKPL